MDTRQLDDRLAPISGIWLPLVTPFREGRLDERSLLRLLRHYLGQPVDGLILAATTGEGLTLDEAETERLAALAAAEVAGRLPLYLGLSGSDTRKLAKTLAQRAAWPVEGYLIACPYYVRPSQEGLYRHFAALAEVTDRPILIYNIPYRTGVNMTNETLLRLAELPNITGLKDCAADAAQSAELLRRKPAGFSVLTGEDAQFHAALAQGADGGILATAHLRTEGFASARAQFLAGNNAAAREIWHGLIDLVRLPMTEITTALAARLSAALIPATAA